MHIGGSIKHSVTFLGFRDNLKPGGIACLGTGFFFYHDGYGYLITVRHVAEVVGDTPFVIRATKANEEAHLLDFDNVHWIYHPDPLVDLATFPIKLTPGMGFRNEYIRSDMLLTDEMRQGHGVDVGDFCYTVGLFHPVYGNTKNMPVVYSGSICLLPPTGERIPIFDEKTGAESRLEALLIECRAIKGASGSPVFVRSVVELNGLSDSKGRALSLLVGDARVHMLGVFQATWIGGPDKLLGQSPAATVPVGIGVVVPASKILDLLEAPELVDYRKRTPPTGGRNFSEAEIKVDPNLPASS